MGLSKHLKQIFQFEHNIVKNPNWLQKAIYKCGFECGATEKQIQVVVRAGLEPGIAGNKLQVRHADHSAMVPPQIKLKLCSDWSSLVVNSNSLTCIPKLFI